MANGSVLLALREDPRGAGGDQLRRIGKELENRGLLGALEAFDRAFPGFHSEAHGVSIDPDTGGYLIECVRPDVQAGRRS
ncbi:hypothetical protein G3I60_41065 [Streptomyces sp. SID13666]|uniref:hypothetical protein n=1 Tax=unclassified Streptomyces TaxID=2593676 RepID=UPI0013C0CC80|nr:MULTISPECIES: hypothetical protein [unclassified Streptomyces]NEA60390.1 hypothetical protein [Streptomyces sp. SID13666]NEA76748.1 hypothetical protein [Streptomyces sp. SID13588]